MTMKYFVVADDQLLTYYDRLRELTSRVHRADRTSLLDLERVNDSIQAIMESRFEDVQPAAVETMTPQSAAPILPPIGEVFELTLPGLIDGLRLVELFGYSRQGWRYTGQPMAEPLTRRFKLVGVGDCRDLNEVSVKLDPLGNIPQGQWMQAFRQAYPQNDGQGPIGVADPSWVSPRGDVFFPLLYRDGSGWSPYFYIASNERKSRWRWLVEVK